MINWGIIGGGSVVQHKSGAGFNIKNKSRVVAVLRRNLTDALHTAARFGASKGYTDLETFLGDSEIDAVYIATPPGLHYQQALSCLNANKIVYVEKPFTITAAEAEDLVEKFNRESIPLFVAHYRRALPKFLKARELIQTKLGVLQEFDFRITRNIERDLDHPWLFDEKLSGGGKFFDIAPHYIDLLIYFFGEVRSTQALVRHIASPNHGEDIVKILFNFKSGLIGSASFNFVSSHPGDKLSVYGKTGELHFSLSGEDELHWQGLGAETKTFNLPSPDCVQAPMILEVVNYLLGGTANPYFGHQALASVQIIENTVKHFRSRTGNCL
jgi:predicted dehydrogenase